MNDKNEAVPRSGVDSLEPCWRILGLELRLPIIHMPMIWPDFIQGSIGNAATSLALMPLLVSQFGLSFEQAAACAALQAVLICTSFLLFGLPLAPGWITPVIPIVLVTVLGISDDTAERFQMMTAVSINFAILMIVIGLTGIGHRITAWVPRSLKAGIILGAAIAAFQRVFVDDIETFKAEFICTSVAIGLALFGLFSRIVKEHRSKNRLIGYFASLGLLPALIVGGLLGAITGELTFNVEWGLFAPDFVGFFQKASPLYIGWPSLEMYIEGMPIALIAYVILFGDIVTGDEVLKSAKAERPDDDVVINTDMVHTSIGIRNLLMAICSPFFGSQGAVWTGVHVLLVQEWAHGRDKAKSLMASIANYYSFGIPWYFFLMPFMTLAEPIMNISLALTMMLTGFACAYVAMDIPQYDEERGVALLTAITLIVFPPWAGLLIGGLACWLIVGRQRNADEVTSTG